MLKHMRHSNINEINLNAPSIIENIKNMLYIVADILY